MLGRFNYCWGWCCYFLYFELINIRFFLLFWQIFIRYHVIRYHENRLATILVTARPDQKFETLCVGLYSVHIITSQSRHNINSSISQKLSKKYYFKSINLNGFIEFHSQYKNFYQLFSNTLCAIKLILCEIFVKLFNSIQSTLNFPFDYFFRFHKHCRLYCKSNHVDLK